MALPSKRRPLSKSEVGAKYGFRSGLEARVAKQLEEAGIDPAYETHKLSYSKPATAHTYLADFVLSNGIVVETKGRFVSADRAKHRLLKDQYPALDLRFVFTNPNARISKASNTSYGDWCDRYGFPYAKSLIPPEWLTEATNEASLAAISAALKQPPKSRK